MIREERRKTGKMTNAKEPSLLFRQNKEEEKKVNENHDNKINREN